jgi:hypothetical protein
MVATCYCCSAARYCREMVAREGTEAWHWKVGNAKWATGLDHFFSGIPEEQ